MAVFNIAVFLWSWNPPGNLHDVAWYRDYFFNSVHGHTGYWLKQSSNRLCLTGQIFDWYAEPGPEPDFSDRPKTARQMIGHTEEQHDFDFELFDAVVVILGIPPGKSSAGGSAGTIKTSNGHVNAMVARIGDPFGFMAHELGHMIGLDHSFTYDINYQIEGDGPGGYGHPHCIMSHDGYGIGYAEAHHDAALPLGQFPEYRGIGPSLNGATALAREWIDAYSVTLTPGFEAEYVIRARQWGGRHPYDPPQGIRLLTPEGETFVVDFYESSGWDKGLIGNRLVLTQDKGGLGEKNYPHTHVGTWLASLRLRAPLSGPQGVINAPGPIGLVPLFYDAQNHLLRVRVKHGVVSGGVIAMAYDVVTVPLSGHAVTVDFEPGERFCVTGQWTCFETFNRQTATLEATHPRAHPGTAVDWTLDGAPCFAPSGTVKLAGKTVSVAHPKDLNLSAARDIEIDYRIEAIPNGSRLILTNRPEDESYQVEAAASFRTSVAEGRCTETVDFSGREYVYPQEFWDRYGECLGAFLKRKVRDAQVKITFDPDQWKRPLPLEFGIEGWLDALTASVVSGDKAGFDLAVATMRHRLKQPDLKLLVFDMADRLEVQARDGPAPPPGKIPTGQVVHLAPVQRLTWLGFAAAALLGGAVVLAAALL